MTNSIQMNALEIMKSAGYYDMFMEKITDILCSGEGVSRSVGTRITLDILKDFEDEFERREPEGGYTADQFKETTYNILNELLGKIKQQV